MAKILAETEEKVQLGQFPCKECCLKHAEEKAKIKAEINEHLAKVKDNALEIHNPVSARDNIGDSLHKIHELLEKL